MASRTFGIHLGAAALTLFMVGASLAASNAAVNLLNTLPPARAAAAANVAPGLLAEHLDTYDTQMKTALKISDPGRRNTAIGVARTNLALSANRVLNPAVIMRIDNALGLPDSPPLLGTTRN